MSSSVRNEVAAELVELVEMLVAAPAPPAPSLVDALAGCATEVPDPLTTWPTTPLSDVTVPADGAVSVVASSAFWAAVTALCACNSPACADATAEVSTVGGVCAFV